MLPLMVVGKTKGPQLRAFKYVFKQLLTQVVE